MTHDAPSERFTMNTVFIVSDGTGGTAHRALNAALTQFKNIPVHIELRAGTRTKTAINTQLFLPV